MAFEGLSEKLTQAFKKLKSKGVLKEADVKEAMREVRLALLEADVNYKVAKDFIKTVTEKCVGSEVLQSLTPVQHVIIIVRDEMTELMGSTNSKIHLSSKLPTIIMMCGLQGSGKTTHSAKLAKMFRKEGHRPLLVACDIYRPAAIDQLKVVGKQVETPVFEMGKENPVKIAQEAIKYAKDYGHDIVILDTAGRLHVDEELMQELQNIKSTVEPHEILLVIDSMTGQDSVNVAESFNNALGIDGVILTKLDGDTRGGAALSVRAVTGKPIKFVGMGEKLDELDRKVQRVEERSPEVVNAYRAKLEAKVHELFEDSQIEDSRIAAEVVMFSDKICNDEETVRLRSHIKNMKKIIGEKEGIGRKLDFMAQEMNREANTILYKSSDLEISNIAIDLKTEIEKIREQIQNVE